jgi:Domain of unknown function (DUF4333)
MQAPPPRQAWQQAPQAPPPAPPAAPKESRVAMITGAVVAIVLIGGLALVGGLWFTGFFDSMTGTGNVLDVKKAEAGVQQILSDPINGYGANDVTSVKCNGGKDPQVEAGKGFTCDVQINGAQRQVQVLFRDDAGTYEVDGPR